MSLNDSATLWLIGGELVLMAVCVGLAIAAFTAKKRAEKKALTGEKAERVIHAFLKEQAQKTSASKLSDAVKSLRRSYLVAESRSCKKEIDSGAYWKEIEAQVSRITNLYNQSGGSDSADHTDCDNKIALLQERLEKLKTVRGTNDELQYRLRRALYQLKKLEESQKFSDEASNIIKEIGDDINVSSNISSGADKQSYLNKDLQRYKDTAGKLDTARLEDRVNQQKKLIESLKSQLLTGGQGGGGDDQSDAGADLEHDNRQISAKLSKAEVQNEELERKLTALRNSMDRTRNDLPAVESAMKSKTNTESALKKAKENTKSKKEDLAELKSTIKQQEEIIADLESAVPSDTEDGTGKEEVEKLKRMLKEAEDCISMLEGEVDTLQDDLGMLETHEGADSDQDDDDDLEASPSKPFDSQHILDFAYNTIEVGSLEDLALAVMMELGDVGVNAFIQVQAEGRTINSGPYGQVSEKEKHLLDTMKCDKKGEPIPLSIGTGICMHNIRGILIPKTENPNAVKDNMDAVKEMFRFSNHLADKISGQQQTQDKLSNVKYVTGALDKVANTMEIQLNHQQKEFSEIVNDTLRQFHVIFQGAELNPDEMDLVKDIEEQAVERMALVKQKQGTAKQYLDKMLTRLKQVKL